MLKGSVKMIKLLGKKWYKQKKKKIQLLGNLELQFDLKTLIPVGGVKITTCSIYKKAEQIKSQ